MTISDSILKDVEIYGFSGKLGSGKNYIAENVFAKMLEPKPTVVLCFADQIKIDGIYKHLLDRNKCWVKKDAYTREVLQRIGTEEGRNIVGKNVWVSNLKEWMIMHAFRGIKRFIITDVRFKNEFEFIKEYGGINIRINAKDRNIDALTKEAGVLPNGMPDTERQEQIASHSSETDLDKGVKFDYKIDNDYGNEHNAIIACRNIIRDINEKNKKDLVIFCDLDNTICECNDLYLSQAEQVKELISQNLEEPIPKKVLDKMFDVFVDKHNGEHFNRFFTLDSFAESLTMVALDFRPFMREMPDGEFNSMLQEVFDIGKKVFDLKYTEIPGRLEALMNLKKLGHLVIYTMGNRLEQVKKLAFLGLSQTDFEIYDFKDETIYRNLKHRYPAKKYVMIGDSYERDIEPAMEAGMTAYFVKSKNGYWYPDEGEEHVFSQANDLFEVYENLLTISQR